MIEITGGFNTALCYTSALDPTAAEQIKALCDQMAFKESHIRIMPDVHAGLGCTIGTTMTLKDKVVPGMVDVDIGCGMETVCLKEQVIDFDALDTVIRHYIPSGRKVRRKEHALNAEIDLTQLRCAENVDLERGRHSIGTLGSGNHFIEIDHGEHGELYLVVHSGSRYLGKEVCEYYQGKAYRTLCDSATDSMNNEGNSFPKDLAYVAGQDFEDYIHDMKIMQRFAVLNRKAMIETIITGMGLTVDEEFTTIHNYIETDRMILRKGAVSANSGEKLMIPINMRDGSLICIGKGNAEWNFSAPHGAGRILSRTAASRSLSMEEYRKEMSGIYSTCVSKDTLDESPMAYKSMDEIVSQIKPTADIIEHIRPIYNFKAP